MKVLRLVSLHLIMGVIVPISLSAGEFGDIYGAHPAAAAMGGAVVSTVNDSSSVYYNVAGLGKLSEGELIRARIEAKELEKQKALEEANLESSTTEEAQDPQKNRVDTKNSGKMSKRIPSLISRLKEPQRLPMN